MGTELINFYSIVYFFIVDLKLVRSFERRYCFERFDNVITM